MPLAAALYGVLLGLGFTTFVLTFGVWALAGISFAVGEPALGLAIGLGFGVGRAIPVVTLAPVADKPSVAQCDTDGRRPELYRASASATPRAWWQRRALSFAGKRCARGVDPPHASAADPSVAGRSLVFQRRSDRGAVIDEPGAPRAGSLEPTRRSRTVGSP